MVGLREMEELGGIDSIYLLSEPNSLNMCDWSDAQVGQ